MATCKDTQIAIISLTAVDFREQPEFANHVASCDDCRQFVADVRDIRHAGGPSWFLQHLPRTDLQELEEEIKANTFRYGFRSTRGLLMAPLFLLIGALMMLLIPSALPPSKATIVEGFSIAGFFDSINTLTEHHAALAPLRELDFQSSWQDDVPLALAEQQIPWFEDRFFVGILERRPILAPISLSSGDAAGPAKPSTQKSAKQEGEIL